MLCNATFEEDYSLNAGSAHDFWLFILTEHRFRRGSLVLIDNGNLRLMWKDDQGTQLGLQFLGDELVQYVVFKRRRATKHISRVAGRDALDGVKRQIDAFELESLVCG